ncbi:4Fe-4S binding protein [Chloroflexota bacterium]
MFEVTGNVGNFHLKVRESPRGVTQELAASAEAIAACPERAKNEFDYGLNERKAIYRPYEGCYPPLPAIDWRICTRCGKCAEAAGGKGINLDVTEPQVWEVRAGTILIATGYEHYEPRHGEYGYGVFPEVITLPQLIRIMDRDGATGEWLEWNGRRTNNIAMIHCVGSRQIESIDEPGENGEINEYCSRVCCTATLQAAKEIRERFPQTNIFDLYQDIRTYGRGHENYYEETSDNLFFRYMPESPPVVEHSTNGDRHPLIVRVIDQLTFNEEIEIPVDLVVLSVGMIPQKISELIDVLKLPVGSDRYLLEVHPKLRPVEIAANGIFLVGTCQGPKDISESCEAASAAAAKAAATLSRPYIELDPFVAVVDAEKCNGCSLCVDECNYPGAIFMEDVAVNGEITQRANISASQCKGCGACVAVCPTRAINVKGWALDQFDAMVDAIAAD